MTDTLTPAGRSERMSKVRAKGNASTELRLVKIFRAHGIKGWRRNCPLPGKPDFVFPEKRLCVFVDGCFWHGCPKCYRQPKSKRAFWANKLAANRARDKIVNRKLLQLGWRLRRVWECELRPENRRLHAMLSDIRRVLVRSRQAKR